MIRWPFALILSFLVSHMAFAASNGLTPPVAVSERGGIEIPISTNGGELWVDVRINDRVTARMLLDTGASVVILPARVAAALDLGNSGRRQELKTLKGNIAGRWVTLDKVGLGGASVDAVSAIVLEDPGDDNVGLLGRSFLNHFSYSVDLDRNVLTLSPRKTGGATAWREVTPQQYALMQIDVLKNELDRARGDRHSSAAYLTQIQHSIDTLAQQQACR